MIQRMIRQQQIRVILRQPGENNSSNSGTTDEERNRKTDTAERKNGVKTGDVADMSVWIAGIAGECRSADSSEDTKTKNKIIHRKPGGCSAGCRQPPALRNPD